MEGCLWSISVYFYVSVDIFTLKDCPYTRPPHPLLKHVLVTLGKVKLVILVFRSTIDYFLNICVCDINHSFVATLVLCNISNVAYFLPKSVGRWK